MYGVQPLLLPLMVFAFLSKINPKCYNLLFISRIPWKIFLVLPLRYFVLIVGENTPKMLFNLFVLLMVFFINLLVHTRHNKTESLNINIDILLIWLFV
jgi:hypothetical protein